MSQDDPQQPDRSTPPRISRDTLLLLGALAFLILAVVLTFAFTPASENGGEVAQGTATTDPAASPGAATAEGGYPNPNGAYPSSVAGASTDVAGGALTSTPPGGYPGPDSTADGTSGVAAGTATALALGTPGQGQFGTPGVEPSLTPEFPFDDSTPAASPDDAATADPFATADTSGAYPQPGDTGGSYPQPEGTPPSQPAFNPTRVQPTTAPLPTLAPVPTAAPPPTSAPPLPAPTEEPAEEPTEEPAEEPTEEPAEEPTEEPAAEPTFAPLPTLAIPAAPAAPPADVLRGNVRWAANQSPIILRRDVQVAPGAELIIEPGVEVRLDPGVSIYVDGGRMLALGLPDRQVRFVGNTGARWSGIYGLPDSYIAIENAQIRGGGVGGTVVAVEGGELVIRSSKVNDNGGAILLTDTKLELRDSEIAGNDMPYGAALDASYSRGNIVVLRGNRIAGNLLSEGAPMVRFANQSTAETLNLEISGNLLRGGSPNLQLTTSGPLKGSVDCNALVGEWLGLGLRTQTPQVGPNGTYTMDLRVANNFIDEHIPPVVPVYLKYGLGRGAASEIAVDLRNNWWGDPSGPYEPDENPEGRGDSVGENITFAPWLSAPPPCAPSR